MVVACLSEGGDLPLDALVKKISSREAQRINDIQSASAPATVSQLEKLLGLISANCKRLLDSISLKFEAAFSNLELTGEIVDFRINDNLISILTTNGLYRSGSFEIPELTRIPKYFTSTLSTSGSVYSIRDDHLLKLDGKMEILLSEIDIPVCILDCAQERNTILMLHENRKQLKIFQL